MRVKGSAQQSLLDYQYQDFNPNTTSKPLSNPPLPSEFSTMKEEYEYINILMLMLVFLYSYVYPLP